MSYEPCQHKNPRTSGHAADKNLGADLTTPRFKRVNLRELWSLPCKIRAMAHAVILPDICGVAT